MSHLSDSTAQTSLEPRCLELASAALKATLSPQPFVLSDGTSFCIDGVNESQRMLCEVFVHMGPLKDGQKKKLALAKVVAAQTKGISGLSSATQSASPGRVGLRAAREQAVRFEVCFDVGLGMNYPRHTTLCFIERNDGLRCEHGDDAFALTDELLRGLSAKGLGDFAEAALEATSAVEAQIVEVLQLAADNADAPYSEGYLEALGFRDWEHLTRVMRPFLS